MRTNPPHRKSGSQMRRASLESVAAELSRILTPGWIPRIPRYRVFYCQAMTLRAISRVVQN